MVLHEQGVRVDDQLESARSRIHVHNGAAQALRNAATSLKSLSTMVDHDLDAEKLPSDPMEVAKYMKMMIDRAVQGCLGAAQHQENVALAANGEVSAYERVVELLKKDVDAEKAKLAAATSAAAEPEAVNGQRPTGTRPSVSIASRRKAEDTAEGKRGRKKNGAHA